MPIRISIPKYTSNNNENLRSKYIGKVTLFTKFDFKFKIIDLNFFKDKWSAFKAGPLGEFAYGKLNILNSSTIIWTYVYSNQTLIDDIQFQKSHKIQVENVFNMRKEFIDSNESSSPINPVPASSYTAKSRQAKLIILFIFTVISLFSIFIVFFFVRKRLRSREKKFFANYSNLVENEFDS